MGSLQWIPWGISAICMIFAALTYFRNGKKDDREEFRKEESKMDGIKEGILKANMKLDTACSTINEMRIDVRSLDGKFGALDKRVTLIEQGMKTMSEDIEELKGKVGE